METQHITAPKSLQALPTEQKPNFTRTAKFEGQFMTLQLSCVNGLQPASSNLTRLTTINFTRKFFNLKKVKAIMHSLKMKQFYLLQTH